MADSDSGTAADKSLTKQVDDLFEAHAVKFDGLLKEINAHVLGAGGGGADEGAATTAAQQRTELIGRISTKSQYAQIYMKIGMIAILKNAAESMGKFKTQLDNTVSEMQEALDPDADEE